MRFTPVILAVSAPILTQCAGTPPPPAAWVHFDSCKDQPTFHEMVLCGKQARQAACSSQGQCTPLGDNVVAYAESLDESVQRREMSEPEARRKWIEFRISRANDLRQAIQGDAAIAAANRSVVCNKVGTSTICN